MGKHRLEAFSDGVLAILITIMVLELKVPHGIELAALAPLIPVFLTYVLSFVYLGIYWNNHHHMLHLCNRVTASILWANLALLFWLSLIPFATGWMGENHFAAWPTALYGVVLLMAALSYTVLQTMIIRAEGAGLAAGPGGSRRLERQAVTRPVRRRDHPCVAVRLAVARHLRRRRAHLADPGPQDRARGRARDPVRRRP